MFRVKMIGIYQMLLIDSSLFIEIGNQRAGWSLVEAGSEITSNYFGGGEDAKGEHGTCIQALAVCFVFV